MLADLERHIEQTPMMDTHEHLKFEDAFVESGPDVLQDLFGNYVSADLVVAGASVDDVQFLLDGSNPNLVERFERIRKAWEAVQFTGYGEATRILAERLYQMPEITPDGLAAAQDIALQLRKPGTRLGLLKRGGNLDHVQVDNFVWACLPDLSGPDFFLYDLSWVGFCNGQVPREQLAQETGIDVQNLSDLRTAMEKLFALYGPLAIAVKAQHAYSRTLRWEERSDAATSAALGRILTNPDAASVEDQLCLGDWAWARGTELSIEYKLPFKIHTGYYAGHSRMPVDRIKGGNLCGLLAHYPEAKFVLMHIAYPYSEELVAIAKHYPNVWMDLCWAWSINPYASCDFVRRFIHSVPVNKLFVFGGDTFWPGSSVAYAIQARKWLTRALEAEVVAGDLNENQAMAIATRLMRTNQEECFGLERARAAIADKMKTV